jgi:hypothetical protein
LMNPNFFCVSGMALIIARQQSGQENKG